MNGDSGPMMRRVGRHLRGERNLRQIEHVVVMKKNHR